MNNQPNERRPEVLECAQAAGADYLVTGNKRHFPVTCKHTHVVNSREFLEIISQRLFSQE